MIWKISGYYTTATYLPMYRFGVGFKSYCDCWLLSFFKLNVNRRYLCESLSSEQTVKKIRLIIKKLVTHCFLRYDNK